MKKSRYSEEQIIGVLKEHQAGIPVAELCRKHGISDATPSGTSGIRQNRTPRALPLIPHRN